MSRKYKAVSKEELAFLFKDHNLWEAFYEDSWKKLKKDLSKIKFDKENYNLGQFDCVGDFVFRWGQAGGDWEYPVHFIVYYDGKDIRGYIPKHGNTWCWTTKQAFGNEEEKEFKFLEKLGFERHPSDDITEACNFVEDFDEMREEIRNHFWVSI